MFFNNEVLRIQIQLVGGPTNWFISPHSPSSFRGSHFLLAALQVRPYLSLLSPPGTGSENLKKFLCNPKGCVDSGAQLGHPFYVD